MSFSDRSVGSSRSRGGGLNGEEDRRRRVSAGVSLWLNPSLGRPYVVAIIHLLILRVRLSRNHTTTASQRVLTTFLDITGIITFTEIVLPQLIGV
jgi:hypothetical protein